jgi:hypothetical protein
MAFDAQSNQVSDSINNFKFDSLLSVSQLLPPDAMKGYAEAKKLACAGSDDGGLHDVEIVDGESSRDINTESTDHQDPKTPPTNGKGETMTDAEDDGETHRCIDDLLMGN